MTLSADQDLQQKVQNEVREVVPNPDVWLDTGNDQLGGKTPRELIDGGKADLVRDLIHLIKYGGVT